MIVSPAQLLLAIAEHETLEKTCEALPGLTRAAAQKLLRGAARGNPGPAGAGAVITDAAGNVLARLGRYLGTQTNNVAEYQGVLLALELARDLGATDVEVVNDSELVARQIGGEYKVKNPGLRPLFTEAMNALRVFDRWSVRNVPRAQNARADELVNEALDAAA